MFRIKAHLLAITPLAVALMRLIRHQHHMFRITAKVLAITTHLLVRTHLLAITPLAVAIMRLIRHQQHMFRISAHLSVITHPYIIIQVFVLTLISVGTHL